MYGNFCLILVNVNTCKWVIHCLIDYNLMDYQNGERKSISHVDSEQDLGIWCTADLKPSFQCQQAVSKAMKVLGLIKRTLKFFNTTSLSKLYKTYVRPHL